MSTRKLMICTIILLLLFPASSFGYTILKTFHQGQYGPGGLAYDEVNDDLWASDLIGQKILKINPNNGSVLTTLNVSYNDLPTGLTYKDGYLWNSDQWAVPEVIHKVNPANGNSVDTIPGLGGLTFDHLGRLWSSDWYVELRALDPNNGAIVDSITLPGFDPSGDDQIMGLAFDNDTETLWVSVVEDRWNPPATSWLLNVALDGTVLSTEEFDPDPALNGYELGGLAFDNNSGTLWANYSLFDRPPTWDDTYIYELSPELTATLTINKIVLKDLDGGIVTENFSPGTNIRYRVKFRVNGDTGTLYKVVVTGKVFSLYKPDGTHREWIDKFDTPKRKRRKLHGEESRRAYWDRQIPIDATPSQKARVKFALKLYEYDGDTGTWVLWDTYYGKKTFNIVQ